MNIDDIRALLAHYQRDHGATPHLTVVMKSGVVLGTYTITLPESPGAARPTGTLELHHVTSTGTVMVVAADDVAGLQMDPPTGQADIMGMTPTGRPA